MTCSPTLESLSGKRIGLLGYGREGRSAARALENYFPQVELTVLVESGQAPDHLPTILGPFDEQLVGFDVLLRSPGVPVDHPALINYREQGGQIVNPSSIWFAERSDVPVIGITGSKGKSTTAALLAHLFESCGRQVLLAGNIGVPLLDHLDTGVEIVVLELSSYQLVDLEAKLSMGLITRLFSEHLDWHGDRTRYFQAKLRMARMLGGRPLLINATDLVLHEATKDIAGVVPVNRPPNAHRRDDALFVGDRRLVDGEDLHLVGRHNLDNAALAVHAAMLMGHQASELAAGLTGFMPLPHRLEPVACIERVRWINDSIATSPYATLAALEALGSVPVTLIAGGQERPANWQPVSDWCREHGLQSLITLPDNGRDVASFLGRMAGDQIGTLENAANLDEAVRMATRLSAPGSVVLLSPGAPSFPHFRDFEQRGKQFAELVRAAPQ